MYNELFSIGPLTIHGYGLMIGIGFIAALMVASYRAKKKGLDADFLFNLAIICLIFGMLGAKLLYIITVLDKIIENPSDFLNLSSGFVVYGGIIVGIAAGMVYCKMKNKTFTDYFDLVMPSISIAQGFGRIGCFLAGCCYGKATDSWFGITFTHSHYAPNNISLIPTQLISSLGNFLIAGALILIARKKHKPGFIAALYLIFYGTGRFFVEMFRGDIERGSIGFLSTSQFISVFIILIGVAYLVYILKFQKVKEATENTEVVEGEAAENVEAATENAENTDTVETVEAVAETAEAGENTEVTENVESCENTEVTEAVETSAENTAENNN